MARTDNYPDDIRSYDSDPRSPFYQDPEQGLDGLTKRELIKLRDQLEGMSEELTGKDSVQAQRRLDAMNDLIDCTPWEDEDYIEAARKRCNDEIEIDEKDVMVSQGNDEGAWVKSWIWVSDEEVEM